MIERLGGLYPSPPDQDCSLPTTVFQRSAVQFALLLVLAVVLRFDTFGDPNLHGDEMFYQTVGVAMHHGATPYVDVWDRKPFGLFLIYYLIAFISSAPLAYQLVATLFVAATAWAIARITARWTSVQGSLLAAVAYLLWLAPLQGYGGQSPVFYNLFIAMAALLVLTALPALQKGAVPKSTYAAMALAGFGITVKTSALFEACFLGIYALIALRQSGLSLTRTARTGVTWAAVGAAPALIIALTYSVLGHWEEYWHAMFTSNLAKETHWPTSLMRLKFLAMALAPVGLFALIGLVRLKPEARRFTLLWLGAAIAGLASVPNFYLHYALPILVPLCVGASTFFGKGIAGSGAAAVLAILSFSISSPFQYGRARESRAAMTQLEHAIDRHVGSGPLLLYDAPPQLYMRTGQPLITPLVFPTHLAHMIEKDVSHLSTLDETNRVLKLKPSVVVMAHPLRNGPVNEETHQLVLGYVGQNCRLIEVVPTLERQRTDMIAVWGDCVRSNAGR